MQTKKVIAELLLLVDIILLDGEHYQVVVQQPVVQKGTVHVDLNRVFVETPEAITSKMFGHKTEMNLKLKNPAVYEIAIFSSDTSESDAIGTAQTIETADDQWVF